ncbi:MAG: tetratricopeptide repeat protein, partial [Draconibacterium sp.]|nr:tetratricopeptide repeat protein [Draconibacterium sp.]
MKIRIIIAVSIILGLFGACKNSEEKSNQKAIKLMTAQTMGLAYLEEFKLEEAEGEFLNYIKMAPEEKLGYANLGLTYLRMGKYVEAEENLMKAIEIDGKDADVRLILATVYQMNNERKKAVETLNEALIIAPGHVKILYSLSEMYSVGPDAESQNKRKECIVRLAQEAPENIVPKLSLIEININNNEIDTAIQQLEVIIKQFPEFPKEATGYYYATLDLLRKNDASDAAMQFAIFHNYMKVTSPYQAGIQDLKGPGGSLIGFPLITYNQQMTTKVVDSEMVLEVIKFSEVSESAMLSSVNMPSGNQVKSHVQAADYDGDGDTDLYVGKFDAESSTYKHFLFSNEM